MSRIIISAPVGTTTGITINDPASFGNVRNFLDANPTLAVSVPTTAAERNLTAIGVSNNRSIWRMRNGANQPEVREATLRAYGGGFSGSYSLPGTNTTFGYDTFVSSPVRTTHIMSFSDPETNALIFSNTKAFSSRTPSSIAPLPSVVGSTVAPFPASSPFEGYSLQGTEGGDTLTITTGTTNDEIFGFGGNDSLSGGAGNDNLTGGMGSDTLTGGSGSDQFFYNALDDVQREIPDTGAIIGTPDTITDFTASEGDILDLRGVTDDAFIFGDISDYLLFQQVATDLLE